MKKIPSLFLLILFALVLWISVFSGNSWAKDLYVATDGSDAVSWAANDINNPWQSVAYAWANAQSNDVVYYRTGSYSITATINVSNGSQNVTHTNYNDEVITWNSSLIRPIHIREPDTTVDGINVNWTPGLFETGDVGFFMIGSPQVSGSPSGFTLRNCVAYSNARSWNGSAGGNTGIVWGGVNGGEYAANTRIENCHITGVGHGAESADYGSRNNCGIIMFEGQDWIIQNCEIEGFQTGIYFNKHSNDKTYQNSQVRNNYVHDCGVVVRSQSNYTLFDNNLFDGNFRLSSDDSLSTTGDVGLDYNTFTNNTIIGEITVRPGTRSGDPLPGAYGNVFQNNIITGLVRMHQYSALTHDSTMNYNLYTTGDFLVENTTYYNFSEWVSYYSQDANSLAGSPTFTGGASPTTIAGFALTAASNGHQAGSDGNDMGADVTLVGANVVAPDPEPESGCSFGGSGAGSVNRSGSGSIIF